LPTCRSNIALVSHESDFEGSSDDHLAFQPVSPSDPVLRRLKNKNAGVSLFEFRKTRTSDFCVVRRADSPTKKVENLIVKTYRGAAPSDDEYLYRFEVPSWAAAFSPGTPLRSLNK